MGKKRRLLTNPKKFGKKHFEILDNMDGTDDNIIASTSVKTAIRTLGLVDNGDRTVSIAVELFGSGSDTEIMKYKFPVTGGVAAVGDVLGDETVARAVVAGVGFKYSSASPAAKNAAGNIFVLPAGSLSVLAAVDGGATDFPGALTTPANATAYLKQSVTIGAAPIGLSSAQLGTALSASSTAGEAVGVFLDLGKMSGSGPQHGSGSGNSNSAGWEDAVYNPTGSYPSGHHGWTISASGSVSGSTHLDVVTGSILNGQKVHGLTGSAMLFSGSQMAKVGAQDVTFTFTPRDVNNTISTDQAVSYTISFT